MGIHIDKIYTASGNELVVFDGKSLEYGSAVHEEELMAGNFIRLSWLSDRYVELPVGTYITVGGVSYILFEEYTPEVEGKKKFKYEPQFQHPVMWLGKVPFMHVEGGNTRSDWTFYGSPLVIGEYFVGYLSGVASIFSGMNSPIPNGQWTLVSSDKLPPVVSCSFSTVDVLSAAAEIADKCGCEYRLDLVNRIFYLGILDDTEYGEGDGDIHKTVLESGVNVGIPSVSGSKEGYYNCFQVYGGTCNMTTDDSGSNYQSTNRLDLGTPGSIIDKRGSGSTEPMMVRELVYDDIYPKMELYVTRTFERMCWLFKENADGTKSKIPATSTTGHLDTDGNYYKYYSKWYVKLAYCQKVTGNNGSVSYQWTDYVLEEEAQIKDLVPEIAFLINGEVGALPSTLAGLEFDLVSYTENEYQKEYNAEEDISQAGFTPSRGWYRIDFREENGIILPTTSAEGMYPKVDNSEGTVEVSDADVNDGSGKKRYSRKSTMCTIANVAVDNVYYTIARGELRETAEKDIARLQSDLNSYTVPSDPVVFHDPDTRPDLFVGQDITFKDGAGLSLDTHIRKLVTRLDHPETVTITVGNEKVKGNVATMKDQIDAIIAGGYGSGEGGMTVSQFSNLLRAYGGRYFLSKLTDDTAAGNITSLKGFQVGREFVSGLLGYGGVFRKEDDGTSYLEADRMYVRMKAIFDTVEIKKYEHSSGNRVASRAGIKCVRVVPYATYGASVVPLSEDGKYHYTTEETDPEMGETVIVEHVVDIDPSRIVYYRCFFRATDGGDTVSNDFAVGDLAYCHITNTVDGSGSLSQKHYWRAVIAKDNGQPYDPQSPSEASMTEEGEGWIDLSNNSGSISFPYQVDGETVTVSIPGYLLGSDIPSAQDDIVQLGHVWDVTRQGAIIEYVSGSDAPSYQIYQGIDNYSLNNKNYINIGYNTAKGKADMKVYGDFYFGDRPAQGGSDGNSYVKYDSGTGKLDIKAQINIESSVKKGDGSLIPLEQFAKGHEVFNEDSGNLMTQTIVIDQTTYTNKVPQPPYAKGDIWVMATYNNGSVRYSNEILVCNSDSRYVEDEVDGQGNVITAGHYEFAITDWELASDYNTYRYLTTALEAMQGTTTIDGGLVLTSLIGLKDTIEGSRQIWSGISGAIGAEEITVSGQTAIVPRTTDIAAWYGGDMIDKETLDDSVIANGWGTWIEEDQEYNPRWAKTLFRFDGSGYEADANISWNSQGAITIKNIIGLYGDNDQTNLLNEITLFSQMFGTSTRQSGGLTVPYTNPLRAFDHLLIDHASDYLDGSNDFANTDVLNYGELKNRFVTIDFFNQLFQAHKRTTNPDTDTVISPNTIDNGITDIKALVGLWTDQYLSALGLNSGSGGGGGGGDTLRYPLNEINNANLPQNPSDRQAIVWNATQNKFEWGNTYTDLSGYTPTSQFKSLTFKDGSDATVGTYSPTQILTLKAGSNVTMSAANNIVTIAATLSDNYYTKQQADARYVKADFFESLFEVYNGEAVAANKIATNGTIPSPNTNVNIKAMFGFWTERYLSALGQSSGGGGGGGIDEDQLWGILGNNDDSRQINYAHLKTALTWNNISGKPSTFTPSAHDHNSLYYTKSEVNGFTWWGQSLSNGAVNGNMTVNSAEGNAIRLIVDEGINYNAINYQIGGIYNMWSLGEYIDGSFYLWSNNGIPNGVGKKHVVAKYANNVFQLDVLGRLYLYRHPTDNTKDVYLVYENNGIHIVGGGLYADTYVSALGLNAGSGQAFDEAAMWSALGTNPTDKQISTSHLGNVIKWLTLQDANGRVIGTYNGTTAATITINAGLGDDYLPLTLPSGGKTINMPGINSAVTFKNTSSTYPLIRFEGNTGGGLGFLGIGKTGNTIEPYYVTAVNGEYSENTSVWNKLLHSGNYATVLAGNVTNAMLAGGITNAKLANSSVTINGTTVSLGGSATTSKWGTARSITISDSDGTNTMANANIDGSANFTLKLPATIKATLTGNASSATKLAASKTLWGRAFDGTANVRGDIEDADNIYINFRKAVILKDSNDNDYSVFKFSEPNQQAGHLGNDLMVGYALRNNSHGTDYKLTLYGRSINFSHGTNGSGDTYWTLFRDNGHVTINANDSDNVFLNVGGATKTNRLYLYKPNANNDTNAVYLEYVNANGGIHLVGGGLYADTYISALGLNDDGGSAFDESAMWVALGTTIQSKNISLAYIQNAADTRYALKTDIPTLQSLTWNNGPANTGNYNGSSAQTLTIPSALSHLTNDRYYITGSATVTTMGGLFTRFANVDDQVGITIGGTAKALTIGYATRSGYTRNLRTTQMTANTDYDSLSYYTDSVSSLVLAYNGGPVNGSTQGNINVTLSGTSSNHYPTLVSFGYGNRTIQLMGFGWSDDLLYRHVGGSTSPYTLTEWKTIAFTDSTVSKANQLATTRYLWGNAFNGTGDIGASGTPADLNYVGNIYMADGKAIQINGNTVVTANTTSGSITTTFGNSVGTTVLNGGGIRLTAGEIFVSSAAGLKLYYQSARTKLYFTSNVYLEYDEQNGGLHLHGAGLYADTYVSALGLNSDSGTSFDETAMWTALARNDGSQGVKQINSTHLTTALSGYVTTGQLTSTLSNYALKTDIPTLAKLTWAYGSVTGASGNNYDGSGAKTFYIPKDTSHLTNGAGFVTSASLGDYLLKTGGTMTGGITYKTNSTRYSTPSSRLSCSYRWTDSNDLLVGMMEYVTEKDTDVQHVALFNVSPTSASDDTNKYGGLIIQKHRGEYGNYNMVFNANTGDLSFNTIHVNSARTTNLVTNLNSHYLQGWTRAQIQPTSYVGCSAASASSYWRKLWSINITDEQYNDKDLVLLLQSGYDQRWGIVGVRIRQNGANGASNRNFTKSLYQISGNIPSDCARLYCDNSTGDCELWVNVARQWGMFNITCLKKVSNRNGQDAAAVGTFYNDASATVVNPPSGDYIEMRSCGGNEQLVVGNDYDDPNYYTSDVTLAYNAGDAYGQNFSLSGIDTARNKPTVASFGYGSRTMQFIGYNGIDILYFRHTNTSGSTHTFSQWKQIAFTDTKVSSATNADNATNATNATTASKLSVTSKTAWGRTYWTSGGVPQSVTGDMTEVGSITMSGNVRIARGNGISITTDGGTTYYQALGMFGSGTNALHLGYYIANSLGYSTNVYGGTVSLYYKPSGGSLTRGLALTSEGYVGIGYGTLSDITYKLDVNGKIHAADDVVLNNDKAIRFKNTSGTLVSALTLNSSNTFSVGYGARINSHNTQLQGNAIDINVNKVSGQTTSLTALGIAVGGQTTITSTTGEAFILQNTSDSSQNYVVMQFRPKGTWKWSIGANSNGSLYFYGNGATRFSISDTNGAVSIPGATTINSTLTVNSTITSTGDITSSFGNLITKSTNGAYVQVGEVRMTYDSSNTAIKIIGRDNSSNANLYATGGVSALGISQTSDIRKKAVIRDISLGMETIANAPTFAFRWKDGADNLEHVGTSAQYWQAALPQAVTEDCSGTLGLDYGVTALVAAICIAKRVLSHEERIKVLEEENARLKKEVEQLKAA